MAWYGTVWNGMACIGKDITKLWYAHAHLVELGTTSDRKEDTPANKERAHQATRAGIKKKKKHTHIRQGPGLKQN